MCKDPVKGNYLRADHLVRSVLELRLEGNRSARQTVLPDPIGLSDIVVEEYEAILAQIDNYNGEELGDIIKRLDIRNPDGNGEVLPPVPFNLMFKSSIGPSSAAPVYLRPETAQGQFLNFRKLLEYNQNAMPFASAAIGKSFRNEISPRSGLLRVREFLMAEIEHFVDPESGKKHDRFEEIADVKLPFLDKSTQLAGKSNVESLSIEEAVTRGIVDNETLGYFLARIYLFLGKIGINLEKLRFRQHLPNEMAHYACDCWDAELLTSYGWIECVGCADRSAYDLNVHMQRTGEKLLVQETLKEPIKITEWQVQLHKKIVGKKFKRDAAAIEKHLLALDQEDLSGLARRLDNAGQINLPIIGFVDGSSSAVLTKDMVTIQQTTQTKNIREYTPNVIEPSFGIGRILYSLLEHVYWHRPADVARGVLSLPLSVAPTKVLIVPLSNNATLRPLATKISQRLRQHGISNRIDSSSSSIGKRYARNDELGTPLGITIDFESIKNGSLTLRERDSTKQVRASEDEILLAVKQLVEAKESWHQVAARLPLFAAAEQEL